MKIALDPEAIDDLIGIYRWIAQDSPGRIGRDEATRLPYIVVYEVAAERDELLVLAIFHGAQDRR
jgi:plasmid stabilization system protein ParE